MHEKPDKQLVQESLAGNQASFRLIVERTQDMVYRVAFRFLKDLHVAEDATQEVYLRLWKNLHKYRDGAKLTTWMYTITTRHCLDILKSQKFRSRLETTEQTGNLSEELDQVELHNNILKAADALTPKQKAVFVLRDLEGLSVKETSRILKMREGNVKSNLYYARKRIHEQVRKDYKVNTQK
jgi:RNA polymerase sigma-70 factor (ECF subfamily)